MAKDPVCSMEVEEEEATSSYRGKTYYFCCPGCKREFEANPDKHVAPAGFGLSTEGLARGSALRPFPPRHYPGRRPGAPFGAAEHRPDG